MNDFTDIVSKAMEVRPDEGDYTGEDGLLYCGKCHTPKEAYFEDGHAALFGRDRHPTNCACQQKRMDEKRLADQQRKHEDTVKELKKDCFDTPKLRDWCFAQDNGANPQMKHARLYPTILTKCKPRISAICSGAASGRARAFSPPVSPTP